MTNNDDKTTYAGATANDDEKGLASVGSAKLVPEWGVSADNQVVLIGITVLSLFALLFGWNSWRGNGDDPLDVSTITNSAADAVTDSDSLPGAGLVLVANEYGIGATYVGSVARLTGEVDSEDLKASAGEAALLVPGVTEVDNRLQVLSPATEETTSPAAEPEGPDLEASVKSAVSAFGISSSVSGDTAVLEGTVATQDDSTSAEVAAMAVDGINDVDNRLIIVKPAVLAALQGAGVADASAEMSDMDVVASGIVDNQTGHDAAIAAAAAVPGVTNVIDELVILQPSVDAALTGANGTDIAGTVSGQVVTLTGELTVETDRAAIVASAESVPGVIGIDDQMTAAALDTTVTDLNALFELNPIQFATSSAVILEESYGTLEQASDILSTVTNRKFEIQGYTDVRGDDAANQSLSQARADSVMAHLAGLGVSTDGLTSVGKGETTEFGEGDSAEALALNRRVQFVER